MVALNIHCRGLLSGLITDMTGEERGRERECPASPAGKLNCGGHVYRRLLFVCNQRLPVSQRQEGRQRRGDEEVRRGFGGRRMRARGGG